MALLANGTIRAWGRGSNGQTAISAPPLTRFRKLATGEQTSFAIADPPDLDGDGIPGCSDNCPTTPNPDQLDCNHNGIGEACETFADCNSNSLPDSCDIASGTSADADANGVPDTCQPDCNLNDLPDTFEIASGLVSDLNADGTPDDCQGARMVRLRSPNLGSPSGAAARVWNVAELALAESSVTVTVDVRGDLNGQTEWADIVLNDGPPRRFFQSDGSLCPSTPDRATITLDRAEFNDLVRETRTLSVRVECPATVDGTECKDAGLTEVALDYVGIADGGDCNGNERLDVVEVFDGTSPDCNANKRPDGCDIASGTAGDCDASGVPDSCELDATPSLDCNGNGRIDSCDLASGGTAVDCDQDGTIDSCQVAADPSSDCNGNLRPDACDVGGGTSADIDADGTPDECQTVSVPGDFGSIQAAIDAAPADRMRIIAVAAGTYAGPIAFNGKPVRVRGAGPSQTILDGTAGQQVSVVRFTGNEPSIAMLEGVTVRGGQSGTPLPSFPSALVGGGVFGIDSAAGLRNCVVEGNSAGFGAGAYFVRCSGSVDDCAFRGNSASADGGGFQSNQGTQRLTDVVVDGNYANSRGGGMHIVQGNTQLTRVQVTGNQCGNIMGGLSYSASLTAGTTLSLVDCAVTGNVTSLNYGGLGVTGAVGVPVSLSGTTICGNTPLPNMFGSYVDLGGNTVCDCAGDLNLDGAVNGADLGLMLAVWGPCGASCAYDLNLDGLVNGADLGLLLSAWGPCGG